MEPLGGGVEPLDGGAGPLSGAGALSGAGVLSGGRSAGWRRRSSTSAGARSPCR
ncbi:hypothetical protein SCE1572_39300 [Sorangium cellulosum So0157-2]|uniref:Uncharacterized protein n=1 Tax=Sorangium cellulosum So0157-2 TaxID=1254432 RepID=S4YB61_SORCE|nr:hypothetical protein SCE1572_39300 [Sorangium cellulosum So0157-2]